MERADARVARQHIHFAERLHRPPHQFLAREAERRGILAPDLAIYLTEIAKSLFYKERTYETVLRTAGASDLIAGPLQDFAASLPSGLIDQKRRDAEAMLNAIRTHLAVAAPLLVVSYELAETAAWRAVATGCR